MVTPFLLLTKNEAPVALGQTRKSAKQMKNIQRRDCDALVAVEIERRPSPRREVLHSPETVAVAAHRLVGKRVPRFPAYALTLRPSPPAEGARNGLQASAIELGTRVRGRRAAP